MCNIKNHLIYACIILVILTIVVPIEIYVFKDCKNVGHTTLYCVFHG